MFRNMDNNLLPSLLHIPDIKIEELIIRGTNTEILAIFALVFYPYNNSCEIKCIKLADMEISTVLGLSGWTTL